MSASMGSSIIQSRSWHEDSGSNEPEQWQNIRALVVSFQNTAAESQQNLRDNF